MLRHDNITAGLVFFTNSCHEIMFVNSLGIPINETEFYVLFSNAYPLLVTWSLVFGQHR